MALLPPIHLPSWIAENRHLLKPPVGNKKIYEDSDFVIMAVGGPNARIDFHIDPGEELFYQVQGDMVLRVVDEGAFRDILIKEGSMFLLPSWVPHSPQRFPDTVGLVIERKRAAGEEDKLRWYCDDCVSVLHEETFPLEDIATQLKAVIEKFNASESLRTCKACGALKSTTPRR